jgi:hypothetical protein
MEIPSFVSNNREKVATTSWSYFITKASKGSWHASTELSGAAEALIALKIGRDSGWGWNDTELGQILSECLGEKPQVFRGFLSQLISYGLLPEGMESNEQAFHSYQEYQNLWDRWEAPPHELTHDAALYCFENWSLTTFMKLWNTYNADNAQDLVVLMLVIILCHKASGQA